ncbi:MAG: ATP-binding cassette domain-containing protein [Coriobacteriales bacterium]|jgi:energy-coupling factor transport system ATP-binding protein|nr:ATP-binding cassette domain-containing protein [Coriobacteriales bacterium]
MLEFRHVSFAYPNSESPAVIDISFELKCGERLCLTGSNGSGKSTLARLANGLYLPQDGSVWVDGEAMEDSAAAQRLRPRVGVVGQNPDVQIVSTTVFDEVAFGLQNLRLPAERIYQRVPEALATLGLGGFEGRDPNTLSGGEKQRLIIAAFLAMRPRYMVFDEPTSMLDSDGRGEVLAAMSELQEQGCGILHITHDPAEAALGDAVLHLEQGRAVGTPHSVSPKILAPERVPKPTSALQAQAFDHRTAPTVGQSAKNSPSQLGRLEADGVSFRYPQAEQAALEDVSFSLEAGEILLLTGKNGAGKSTLLALAAGLEEPSTGQVRLDAQSVQPGQVGLVFQHPELQLFAQTVERDILFGPHNLGLTGQSDAEIVEQALSQVGLDYQSYRERLPFTLSGGEARRVALAGVLAMRPRFLLLDEPTAGLDLRGQDFVFELLRNQARVGVGILLVSHDIDKFLALADRRLFLAAGHLSKKGPC